MSQWESIALYKDRVRIKESEAKICAIKLAKMEGGGRGTGRLGTWVIVAEPPLGHRSIYISPLIELKSSERFKRGSGHLFRPSAKSDYNSEWGEANWYIREGKFPFLSSSSRTLRECAMMGELGSDRDPSNERRDNGKSRGSRRERKWFESRELERRASSGWWWYEVGLRGGKEQMREILVQFTVQKWL